MSSVRQVSSLFKIGRWTALGVGLSYGFLHARTLRNAANERRADEAYAHQVDLIEQAKRKYAESRATPQKDGEVQFNFDDPNFDADQWAKHLESKFN